MHLLTPVQKGVTPVTFSSLGTFRQLSDMDETIYSLDSGDAFKTSLHKLNSITFFKIQCPEGI